MQLAMAASMGVAQSGPVTVDEERRRAAEVEDLEMARAIAESLGRPAEASSIPQIQARNDLY